jgi:hypothetical protein
MGDCYDKYGRRPDGGPEPSRRTTVRQNFWDFCWKSFLFESRVRKVRHCRPDGRTFAASNFHIRLRASGPRGMAFLDCWSSTRNFHIYLARIQTMIGMRLGGWSWIRNFHICWTWVRTKLTDVQTVVFELRFLPYVWARPDGNPRRPKVCINLPLFELGKKIWSWSITGRSPDGLLRCPNGCKLEQKLLDADECPDGNPRRPEGWCFVCRASKRYGTSSRRLELWTDERPDEMTCHPDGWQGTKISDL